jgi:hypothetical protein
MEGRRAVEVGEFFLKLWGGSAAMGKHAVIRIGNCDV